MHLTEKKGGQRHMKNVAVIGGAGYAGIELVRYLLGHPGFDLVAVTSDQDAGTALAELYPALTGRTDLAFVGHGVVDGMAELDAAFLAVPHTAAMEMAPALLGRGICVFDLSADFRLKDAAVYERFYGARHSAPELLAQAVYGLPEVNRPLLKQQAQGREGTPASVPRSALVACPGCYPTASTLALAPALAAGFAAEGTAVVNAVSGVSGAGRTPRQGNHFCSANENVNAYGVATHRHLPEIAQVLAWQAGRRVPVVFTPHLAPLTRGLLATATLPLGPGACARALEDAYGAAYEEETFVQLLPYGTMPRTASVVGTNNAQVGIVLDEGNNVLVASCAIDNLGKGAASQAVQCANIVFGFEEAQGLVTNPGVV
ncbi:MAG: N-acetyl-gamma-glutamyl-phosphate reductase [Coriobacteriales bacterium]|jgi:N-acetyl-gamma-glutamyl-phosphate reductase|nr:N-acetyl-gamma-glutamyl-phosphate reductase [Coriobacteriales bacterium]